MERIGTPFKGIFRDILKGPDHQVLYDSGWSSNTIVDSCRVMLAGFMKQGANEHDGIQYLAVGEGKEEWDCQNDSVPPPPQVTETNLVTPYSQVICVPEVADCVSPRIPLPRPTCLDGQNLTVEFLDQDDKVIVHPTNRLQITAILPPGYPTPQEPSNTYPLREFGLFGCLRGHKYMINCIRHPVIHKDQHATLERMIRLQF